MKTFCLLSLIFFFGCKEVSENKVHITATANQGGTILPSGLRELAPGSSLVYMIKPETGYTIDKVEVNGVEVAVTNILGFTYELKEVITDMSIQVFFRAIPFNDYLPLQVGAKYRFKYSKGLGYIDGNWQERGECTWIFSALSTDTVYTVDQSFTGYYITTSSQGKKDSILIQNEISQVSFKVLKTGEVNFTFEVPYWGAKTMTMERFIQSDKTDTCLSYSPAPRWVCLRKDIGITDLDYFVSANHMASVHYTLIDGPN